ncbi:MAG: hypothetical protein WDN66_03935 [Candidatus Saccharibacteria bacterium]
MARLKFGLDGEDPKSYEEIAELRGVTASNVRQVLAKTRKRMRLSLAEEGIDLKDLFS